MRNFKNLKLWEEAMNMAEMVYVITEVYSKDERFNLISQSRRAATSVPSNIAEGCGYDSDAQLNRFLQIAQGSAFELETQLLLAKKLKIIVSEQGFLALMDKINHVQKMIYNFQQAIK